LRWCYGRFIIFGLASQTLSMVLIVFLFGHKKKLFLFFLCQVNRVFISTPFVAVLDTPIEIDKIMYIDTYYLPDVILDT
jgi:hypothetical protein